MSRHHLLFAVAVLTLADPVGAQTPTPVSNAPTIPAAELPQDRGYDERTPKHDAIDAEEAPTTAALNEEAAAAAAPSIPVEGPVADAYRADLDAYARAVERNEAIDEARYARQQSAYAQAMAAWRLQVAACEDGKRTACQQAAPNPADY